MTDTSQANAVSTSANNPSQQYLEIRDRLEVWLNNNREDFKRALTDLVREGKVSREALKCNNENSPTPAAIPPGGRTEPVTSPPLVPGEGCAIGPVTRGSTMSPSPVGSSEG